MPKKILTVFRHGVAYIRQPDK